MEIGRLVAYAVWPVQTTTAVFAFIQFILFYSQKNACGHEFL
jgi:hypothetical protein